MSDASPSGHPDPASAPAENLSANGGATTSGNGICRLCGSEARVRVLHGYAGGNPVLSNYCLQCADTAAARAAMPGESSRRSRLSFATLLILGGITVGAGASLGDYLGVRASSGFGGYQETGVVLSAVAVIVGALLRIDVLALLGTMAFFVCAGADLAGIGTSPGLGWKQQAVAVLGAGVAGLGLWLRRRDTRQATFEGKPPSSTTDEHRNGSA